MTRPVRQLCALLHEGRVLTDDTRRVPELPHDGRHASLAERAATCGDPRAIAVAPQLLVEEEPLALLSVFGPRADPVPGRWTPVDELDADPALLATLRSVVSVVEGHVAPPARRAGWFSPAWYDEVEDWLDEQLGAIGRRRTGPFEPQKMWSLAAVGRAPSNSGMVWLKGACRHFHAEPSLTRLVSELLPRHAPSVIASDDDRGWLLMDELAGVDYLGDDPVPPVGAEAARVLARLQLASVPCRAELEEMGLPTRDLGTTAHQVDQLLTSSVELDMLTREERATARSSRDAVRALLDELAGLGLPDTLVHGDLHTGNLAYDGDTVVVYDWSDAAVSHPFLDLVQLSERLSAEEQVQAREAYAGVWRSAYPAADIGRALELAVPANSIYQMISYEQIYRAGEDASYWEMRGVVARTLRSLPELLAGTIGT